ncbi:MAG: hypothetical protein ACOYNI_03175 [Acidimicrobiia bacterium]
MTDTPDIEPPTRRRLSRPVVVAIALVATLVIVAAVSVIWWRDDQDFCHQVKGLPNATSSVSSTGSPAKGLLAYAGQLDRVADAAPNEQTAASARQIAAAERAAGNALAADPTSAAAVTAIANANSQQVVAAQTQLSAEITKQCG